MELGVILTLSDSLIRARASANSRTTSQPVQRINMGVYFFNNFFAGLALSTALSLRTKRNVR